MCLGMCVERVGFHGVSSIISLGGGGGGGGGGEEDCMRSGACLKFQSKPVHLPKRESEKLQTSALEERVLFRVS